MLKAPSLRKKTPTPFRLNKEMENLYHTDLQAANLCVMFVYVTDILHNVMSHMVALYGG